ncbi:MAG: hypothetical protein Q7T51_02315, partial [Candidatus Moranbacteria bacterium]|nr:hypothetical protein [Candidatus Moranbacteria bacterium]
MESEVPAVQTEIMDKQAEARRAAFVVIENEKARSISELDGHNYDDVSVNLEKAEISYADEEVEKFKEEMDATEQAWLKKKEEQKKHQMLFRTILWKE